MGQAICVFWVGGRSHPTHPKHRLIEWKKTVSMIFYTMTLLLYYVTHNLLQNTQSCHLTSLVSSLKNQFYIIK